MAIKFEEINALIRVIETKLPSGATIHVIVPSDLNAALEAPKRTRAPNGTFDKKAYQRELMRKRRNANEAKEPK